MKKVSRYIKAISIFFQNYEMCILCNESGFDSLLWIGVSADFFKFV